MIFNSPKIIRVKEKEMVKLDRIRAEKEHLKHREIIINNRYKDEN